MIGEKYMIGSLSEKPRCFGWGFLNRFDYGSLTLQKEIGKMEVSRQRQGEDEGLPNDALSYAFGHLDLRDLLSVEKVCKSLRFTIENDVLLWKTIRIDWPSSTHIDDDSLLRLTNRAQGNLLCLSIGECLKITDNGLRRVLESNPRLENLNVSGCVGMSNDGIVDNLKTFKSSSAGRLGIKKLRIGVRYGMTLAQFEEINCLVGTQKFNVPHYYHHRNISCEDVRVIDIEICPKCENINFVYDCPEKSCRGKQKQELCRGCIRCIPRCVGCGQCVYDSEHVEIFNLDLLCLECWRKSQSLQERQNEKFGALAVRPLLQG